MINPIFEKLAKQYGYYLEPKADATEFYNQCDISVTAILSQRLATITLIDSNVNVVGSNKRSEKLNEIIQEFEEIKLQNAIEIALGTGDCLLKPYTDGKGIGISVLGSQDFAVGESIGDTIKSCFIKCDERKTKNHIYERVEYHYLEDGALHIEQFAFKNSLQCKLEEAGWQYEDVVIPNVNQMCFGRIKCPTVNRKNINSINGVPITDGQKIIIKNIIDSYRRFNSEMSDKEAMIFADKSLFTESGGVVSLPKRKLFQTVRSKNIDDALIKEYSPNIRSAELIQGIEQNWRMLETACGLSNGVVTAPTTNFATATEIKTNLGMTFAYMQNLRKMIENGINNLAYALDVICNLNNITPLGTYEIVFDWSDSYVQDIATRATLLLQGEAIGAIKKEEFRSLVMNEPISVAEERLM